MAIQSKFHHPSPVKEVRVSEGSRRDAAGVRMPHFENYEDEYQWWLTRKRDIEGELVGYSATAMSAEQSRIRRKHHGDENRSFGEWMRRKEQMHTKRQGLLEGRKKVEEELGRLKPFVKSERARRTRHEPIGIEGGTLLELHEIPIRREDGSLSYGGLGAQILLELRAIRRLLSEGNEVQE
jgi:hypothetical protein